LDDFANYKAKLRDDSQVIYTRLSGGRTICGPPPPSGSAVTHAIINILDTYVRIIKLVRGIKKYNWEKEY